MGYFNKTITTQGETLSYYEKTYESGRNATTNLKEIYYATATNITAVVRSQPNSIVYGEEGIYEQEVITILTKTQITEQSVVKWNNKYYDVDIVEDVYWNKRGTPTLQYYKARCIERIEFIGS